MKRIINEVHWQGEKYIMEWVSEPDYSKLDNITQVYCTAFDKEGKICLIALTGKTIWNMPGGDIEKGEDWKKALMDKSAADADIILDEKSITPLGYLKITPKNKDNLLGVHYLLRVAAKISKVKQPSKTEFGDIINERVFIELDDFPKYCLWGRVGVMIIEKAKAFWKNSN